MRCTAQQAEFIENYLASLFGSDLHVKRVGSLAQAVLGVMVGASLAVAVIGRALAQARGTLAKHAIKQVDRLLSNQGVDVWELAPLWIEETIGASRDIVVAMDWTEFDADDQSTLVLSLVTKHGRAQPLLWLSTFKSDLKGNRNEIEDLCLAKLKGSLPGGTKVTILADRGFGDVKLFNYLEELGFGYVIRFRGDTFVSAADGETRRAVEWVGAGGRARKLTGAEISKDRQRVGAVVCVHAKGMKEAWLLAASDSEATTRAIVDSYSRRWTIEPGFRDTKDLRFGMGLSFQRIGDPGRRDRLLFISAIAVLLLTLLGGAGEALGMDRFLKSNTVKRRVHSLFHQGCYYYEAIPNMPEPKLSALMQRFQALLLENRVTAAVLAVG